MTEISNKSIDIDKKVINILGKDSYNKGKKYYDEYVEYFDDAKLGGNKRVYNFTVESESFYVDYNVSIFLQGKEVNSYSCNCRQFYLKHTCKHIAACMLKYPELIFKKEQDPIEFTKEILNSYYSNIKSQVKEKLNLNLELTIDDTSTVRVLVGQKKMYVLNTEDKFNRFISAIEQKEEYKFGINLTYNPNKHYFDDDDIALLNFLKEYEKTYNYYYGRKSMFELNKRELNALLDKLNNKKFTIKGYGIINKIETGLPTNLKLDIIDDTYHLNINDYDNYEIIDEECNYIAYANVLYKLSYDDIRLLKVFFDNDITELVFKKEQKDVFTKGLLKEIKNKVDISDKITDIIVAKKPMCSLYFDLKRASISCQVKLDYAGNIIDYFTKDTNVVRDDEYEEEIISKLKACNFEVGNSKITLADIDDIGNFLNSELGKLSDFYNVYTSKKIDNMNLIKKSNIKSNFSIGKDGIMSYSFDTDNIDLSEIGKIMSSLKSNKKYYKLKSGDLVDLSENKELNELNNLLDDLDINANSLEDGVITIPKYRAFYIDSLKSNKYKSIHTNNSFDEFINNFKKYKDIDIKLSKEDKKILRDYQKDGVKWLYTLYKCDLGGILADEMGLGKSLQTIALIKLILKEKKDAKIMIVCPTSLVYNWKREFEKFAPDLKYVTVADNKDKRKEIISNFEDYNVFITSYGLVRNDGDEYEKIDFELCVIDEAQNIKNYQSNMAREIKKIKARTKIALTGTPLENSVLELWSIFDFIMPGYLNSINKFRENYGIKDVDKDSLDKLALLSYQISPFILRRKKNEVTKDLPDKIENNIYLELADIQKGIYLETLKQSEEEIEELIKTEGFQKSRFKILQLLMKLRQICVDPSILYSNYNGESIKFEKMLEIVNDYIKEGHKILIFSSFKRVVDKVKEMFDKNNISSYMISGEVKSKTRMELVDKFNKDDTNCFLITLKSGGTGLNLTSADVVIHLDIWWNPQVENQATDRAHRIGQKNTVSVIKLITKGTIEERIVELQDKKKILSDNLIEGKNNADTLTNLTEEDIKNLLAYGEDD